MEDDTAKEVDSSPSLEDSSSDCEKSKETIIDLTSDDSSYPAEIPPKSPFKPLSPRELTELQTKVAKNKKAIENNRKLLRTKGSTLPDNGAKLKAFIAKLEEEYDLLSVKLRSAEEYELQHGNATTMTPSETKSDEERLEQLRQRQRSLLQQSGYIQPNGNNFLELSNLKTELGNVRKEIYDMELKIKREGAAKAANGRTETDKRFIDSKL